MEVRICKEKNCVRILLTGRLDSTAAATATTLIEKGLAEYEPISDLVCDAQDLEYISSAGLRIFLMLAKKYCNFRVTNATQNVYEVFDMTGFTKMMTVERALRRLSIDGLEEIGRGGVGMSSAKSRWQKRLSCWECPPPFRSTACKWETSTV